MEPDGPAKITSVLVRVSQGERAAEAELLALVDAELKTIAAARLSNLRAGGTLQATALVHEAWIRLGSEEQSTWESRAHYFGAAANAMRNILVDQARSRSRLKRNAPGRRVEFSNDLAAPSATSEVDFLQLDEHLTKFGRGHRRAKKVVMLRYFAGLTTAQISEALGMSPRSVDREWVFARTWLRRAMDEDHSSDE